MRLLASVFVFLFAGPPGLGSAFAQQRIATAPFETVGLSLAAVANVNRTGFHDLWHPGPGGEIAAAAPFYLGWVELGAERMSFDGRGDNPDYRAWFVFAGWGLDLGLLRRLRWEPGLRVGNYAMRFSGAAIPEDRRAESEFGAEAVSRVVWEFAPAWDLLLTGRYRAVLTDPGIRHAFAAVGVRRTFGTPRWLRDFLD